MVELIEVDGTVTDVFLDALAGMNVCLRRDERMDDVMSDEDVRRRMAGFLTGGVYKTFVLKKEEDLLGYGLIDCKRKPAYLRQLFVKEEFRGSGYGKMLVELIMERQNLSSIDIEVMCRNDRAIAFYEKNGFRKRYIGMRYEKGS